MVNGYFEEAGGRIYRRKMYCHLETRGYDILKIAQVDLALSALIAEEFSVQLAVEFSGTLSVSDEDFESLIASLPASGRRYGQFRHRRVPPLHQKRNKA